MYIFKTIIISLICLLFVQCSSGDSQSNDDLVEAYENDDGSGKYVKRLGIEKVRNHDYKKSNFHTSNINKVLFSSNINLNPEKAKAKDFKSDFTFGEVIKGVVFLNENAGNVFGVDDFPVLQMRTASKKYSEVIENSRLYDNDLSYLEFFINVPAEQYIPTKGGRPTIALSMEFLNNLSDKTHKLSIKLKTKNHTKLTGEFNLDATNKPDAEILENELFKIRLKRSNSMPLPKALMVDKKIEKQLVEHFNTLGWTEKFYNTIILSDEFHYKKSYAGVIVAKTLSVAMVSKTEKGYCMYQVFTVKANKTDNGYNKFKKFSVGDQTACTCNK